jgi:hypothetical protein
LDDAVRAERKEWARALLIALALFAVLVLLVWGPTRPGDHLVHGTVLGTLPGANETHHVAYLVVELDEGGTISITQPRVVPVGSRVTLNERRNWYGKKRYQLIEP